MLRFVSKTNATGNAKGKECFRFLQMHVFHNKLIHSTILQKNHEGSVSNSVATCMID